MPRKARRLKGAVAVGLLAALLTATATPASPAYGDERLDGPEADFRHVADYAWFLFGAATAFVGHELGHVMTDVFFGKSISFQTVHLGPIPFFAIQPCCNLTPREMYVIGSAGFVTQDVSSELILWITPRLRARRHAFLKGVLALDVLLSIGYAVTGIAGVGPPQSDVNTMARGLGIPSWQVGLMLLAPATVDVYRYFVPRSVWAPWVSLQGKLMMVGAAFTF